MVLEGKAHKFGEGVNTDIHISVKYLPPDTRMEQLIECMLEQLDAGLKERRRPGDFIVAGMHFGAVSSREDAVEVIKAAGIGAVIAQSFGHMFYRNAINLGLLVIEADTSMIETGDRIVIDTDLGKITDIDKDAEIFFAPLPKEIMRIITEGGLLNLIKKNGSL